MEVGDTISRNFSQIFSTNGHTDVGIKSIKSGAVYKIIAKNQQDASYVYTIQNKPGDTYKVAKIDLVDHFAVVKELKSEEPAKPQAKECTCDSRDLMLYGCKCKAVPNKQSERYEEMLQKMMGPRMEGK